VRERRHIRTLDGIRGIAVILVIAVHFQNMEVLPRTWTLLEGARKSMPVIFVVAGSALLLLLMGGESWNSYDALVYGHLLLGIGFGCFILWAYLCDGNGKPFDRFLRSRVLTEFGKYSYSIYIYQGIVLVITLHCFGHRPWWGHSTRYAAAVAIGWITVPLLMTLLSYHLFEKKLLRSANPFPGRSTRIPFPAEAELAPISGKTE
jgi:peptidoglycan/LPS O-acetylase OafA/YrhL